MIIAFFAAVLIMTAVDQLTKLAAASSLTQGVPVCLIRAGDTEILTFSLFHNSGAAFSSFEGRTIMLTGVTVIFLGVIVFYIIKNKPESKFLVACLSMIAGGGAGNLIDRIRLSYVVDFIHLWPFSFIFNAADVFVVFGTILLFVYFIFIDKGDTKENQKKTAVDENE